MAAGRDRGRGPGRTDLDSACGDDRKSVMNTPEITWDIQYSDPKPILITYEGIEFPIKGALVTFYRMLKYMDALDKFWTDLKPYWWKHYQIALKIKQAEEERNREIHDRFIEQRNLKKNAKRKQERLEKKNGVISPENAVVSQ